MGRKIAILLILVLMVPFVLFAQTGTITGSVIDKDTKEALPGVNVTLKGTPRGTSTNLEGKFNLSIPAGTYTVQVSMVGYAPFQKQVTLAADATVDLNVELTASAIQQTAVEVTANRAIERETPVAFSNVSGDAIKRAYAVEDPVGLIKMVPNVYAYSEGGAGMGDTNVKVRGFDQERVQVMINGIAVNDPESQKVYWSNWAGLSGSTKDIQVQRGVGSSLYGTNAFGGSINVETMNYPATPSGSVKYSTGTYGTYNAAFNYNTGLLMNNHSSFGINIERKFGNAFREGTWFDGYSYALGGAYYTNAHSFKVNFYGAPQEHGNAFQTQKYSDLETYGRNYNKQKTPYDFNKYHKPQFELHHDWTVNSKSNLHSTFFVSKGNGYGSDAQRSNASGLLYDATGHGIIVQNQTWKRERWNNHLQFGLLSNYKTTWNAHDLYFGFETRKWKGDHYGTVAEIWEATSDTATVLVRGGPGNATVRLGEGGRYYDYTGNVFVLNFYARGLWRFIDNLVIMTDATLTNNNTNVVEHMPGQNNTTANLVDKSVKYNFYQPKIGVSYNVNEYINLFTNYSRAFREQNASDVYNRGNWNTQLKAEQSDNIELGSGYESRLYGAKLNLYYTKYKNRAVSFTDPITQQKTFIPVGSAVHQGIELEGAIKPMKNLRIDLSFSYADNHWVDLEKGGKITIQTSGGKGDQEIKRSDDFNSLPDSFKVGNYYQRKIDIENGIFRSEFLEGKQFYGTPRFMSHISINYSFLKEGYAELTGNYFGESYKYVDNFNKIPVYTTFDIIVGYTYRMTQYIKGINFQLKVLNLLDEKSYVNADGFGVTPGPPRTWFGAIQFEY